MFRRKIYNSLLEWKSKYDGKYACLIEGARRVGKTTVAESFAKEQQACYFIPLKSHPRARAADF